MWVRTLPCELRGVGHNSAFKSKKGHSYGLSLANIKPSQRKDPGVKDARKKDDQGRKEGSVGSLVEGCGLVPTLSANQACCRAGMNCRWVLRVEMHLLG